MTTAAESKNAASLLVLFFIFYLFLIVRFLLSIINMNQLHCQTFCAKKALIISASLPVYFAAMTSAIS